MKVLFLTYSPSPYRVDFFEELGKLADLTVCYEITPEEDKIKNGRNSSWYGKNNSNYQSIYLKNKKIFKKSFSFELIKIINNGSFDIIVIGGYSSLTAMITMQYLKRKKIPFILNTDGGFPKPEESKIKFFIKKHFISMADYYLSTGKNANNYLKYYGANMDKTFIYPFTTMREKDINNSIISKKQKEKIRKEINIENKITFISIGRFVKRKGFDILLKASNGIKNAQFIIVGDKPTKEYLDIVDELGLDNVIFTDFKLKEELLKYLNASDVFVLPTREDIWGLVINEALSTGIPVITTNNCGAGLDLIKDNYNGFLVNVEDILELHKKMEFFVDNEVVLKRMSENALNSIKDYTIENEAKRHFEVFTEILNKRGN